MLTTKHTPIQQTRQIHALTGAASAGGEKRGGEAAGLAEPVGLDASAAASDGPYDAAATKEANELFILEMKNFGYNFGNFWKLCARLRVSATRKQHAP